MQNRSYPRESLLSNNADAGNNITTDESPWVLRNSPSQPNNPLNTGQNKASDMDNAQAQDLARNMDNTTVSVLQLSYHKLQNDTDMDNNQRKKANREKEKEEAEQNTKDWTRLTEICDSGCSC